MLAQGVDEWPAVRPLSACCHHAPLHTLLVTAEAVPSPVALLEASIASSRSAQSAMQSSADGLIPRLEANTDAASSRTTAATSILITAVQQCVSTFGYSLRRHTTAVDKLLGAKTDELDDTVTTLEACLQQIYCSESSLEYLEASMRTIQQLCGDTNAFPDVSLALHAAASDVLQLGRAAFRLQTTIDPIRCAVSHAPWLARGKVNSLSINVFDAVSEPVTTITPADVSVTTAREAQGWSVEIVSIEGNSLSFGVMLTPECSDVGELNVTIDGHSSVYALKVRVLFARFLQLF